MFLSPNLLKFCEIKGVKFLASKSGGVKVLTNLMSEEGLLIKWQHHKTISEESSLIATAGLSD